MNIYDISVPLSEELPVYPGDPPLRIEPVTRIARGDEANLSRITLSSHSGTHLDPPRHFNDGGTPADQVSLSVLMGKALLVEIPGIKPITRSELERFPIKGEERLIIKTGNSLLWKTRSFSEEFSHLTGDGAAFLVELGIALVGIDYLSIERFNGDGSVHRTLLDGGVIILEGLDLDGVPPGNYELVCLPMRLTGCDGAPARTVLISP
jgi:arylformamidase